MKPWEFDCQTIFHAEIEYKLQELKELCEKNNIPMLCSLQIGCEAAKGPNGQDGKQTILATITGLPFTSRGIDSDLAAAAFFLDKTVREKGEYPDILVKDFVDAFQSLCTKKAENISIQSIH